VSEREHNETTAHEPRRCNQNTRHDIAKAPSRLRSGKPLEVHAVVPPLANGNPR
jgi:hypothetical protein